MKSTLGAWIVRKIPIGITAAPFEFAFMAGYALSAGKVIVDRLTGSTASGITIRQLPFGGSWEVYYWLGLLFIGALTACVGLLTISKNALFGLQLERAGLFAAGAAILIYLGKIAAALGVNATVSSIGLVVILLELLAVIYKIVLINHALHDAPKKGRS